MTEGGMALLEKRKAMNELQNTVFELLFAEIEKTVIEDRRFVEPSATPAKQKGHGFTLDRETVEERYLFELLKLLHTISDTEASQQYISTKRLSGPILHLLPNGT